LVSTFISKLKADKGNLCFFTCDEPGAREGSKSLGSKSVSQRTKDNRDFKNFSQQPAAFKRPLMAYEQRHQPTKAALE